MYKNKVLPYVFIMPFLIFACAFLIYPFVSNIVDSFRDFDSMLDTKYNFIGFGNYVDLFSANYFHHALLNTGILIILVIVFQVGIALILALLVSLIIKFATFFKVAYFMPIVISATAIGLMFNMFYDYDYGALNQLREFVGLGPIAWVDIKNVYITFVSAVVPVIWQYVGFYFVIFMAALANISDEVLEASEIDGCNRFQQLYLIKIPMLRNIISTVVVLAITGTLKVFDLPFLIAPHGLPNGKTHFLGTLMHEYAFSSPQLGVAAAFAVVMVLLGIGLSAITNAIFKQVDYL